MKKCIICMITVALLTAFFGCSSAPQINITETAAVEESIKTTETVEATEKETEPETTEATEKETEPEITESAAEDLFPQVKNNWDDIVGFYRQEIKTRMKQETFMTLTEKEYFESHEYQIVSENEGAVKWMNPNFLTDCYHAILVRMDKDIFVLYTNRYGFISSRNITSGGKDGYAFVHTSSDDIIAYRPNLGVTFEESTGKLSVWEYDEVIWEETLAGGYSFAGETEDDEGLIFYNGNEMTIFHLDSFSFSKT